MRRHMQYANAMHAEVTSWQAHSYLTYLPYGSMLRVLDSRKVDRDACSRCTFTPKSSNPMKGTIIIYVFQSGESS